MNIKKRQEHWDAIYTDKCPEVVSWFQTEPTTSLKIIQNIKNTNPKIIDVGAGASLLVDCLLKMGYSNLSVLDISMKALEHSKQRLGKLANNIEWLLKDVTEFIPSKAYDIWHDRAVFHFLTDKKSRESYIKTLGNALLPEGYAIIATFSKDGPKKCSGLDIVQYNSKSLQQELGDEFILLESVSEVHLTPKGHKQAFIYCIFQRKP